MSTHEVLHCLKQRSLRRYSLGVMNQLDSVSTRVQVLERSLANSRRVATIAVAVASFSAGAFLVAATQTPAQPPTSSTGGGAMAPGAGAPFTSVVVAQSSGRWNYLLLTVLPDGNVRYLDTSTPVNKWLPFKYSPDAPANAGPR